VGVTFGKYFVQLTGTTISDRAIAAAALALLTIINCLGVRSGSNTQSALMLMKLAAIAALIVVGFMFRGAPTTPAAPSNKDDLLAFAAAMTPVMFAYGGWQTASFISGELKRPERDLAIGLLLGVVGVIVVYVLVNIVCVRVLGPWGLAQSEAPASDVMRAILGERGARTIALGIAISALGFLSQSMLTAPRVYYAMAADGIFFRTVARIHPKTQVPIIAIALQGVVAIIITWTRKYGQILNYVVSIDFIFFGLTGLSLFIFRRRLPPAAFRAPGHPVTTAAFTLACWAVVIATIAQHPTDSVIGLLILLAGLPAYLWWSTRRQGM
jgi:basic amino acid/polyamine antiporter, APA family